MATTRTLDEIREEIARVSTETALGMRSDGEAQIAKICVEGVGLGLTGDHVVEAIDEGEHRAAIALQPTAKAARHQKVGKAVSWYYMALVGFTILMAIGAGIQALIS